MERLSPKIEIINHFDNLINRIDIDIDSSIEKYNDKQLISEILLSSERNRGYFKDMFENYNVEFFEKIDSSNQNLDSWPESITVVDYLKQVRIKTIEELKNAQEETIEYYKINSERFKSELANENKIEELRSELFAEKFYFQVNCKQSKKRLWAFNVFTFVTDFYLSQSDIDSLEKLINFEVKPIDLNTVLDNKMVLTGLLLKCFIDNLLNFPNHVIHVRKEDVLNIKSIDVKYTFGSLNLTSSSTIDLSKLEDLYIHERFGESVKFRIEGLFSLKTLFLGIKTKEVELSIKNLPSLIKMGLFGPIDEKIVTRVLDQVPYIQELHLHGEHSYFNLDSFVNLRMLLLYGHIDEKFNFELLKNLCNQLEDITISFYDIDEKKFFKLFDGYNFPYLVDFTLWYLNIKRLTKEFINRLPIHRRLNISYCKIEVIESDSFSNMQQLTSLNLSHNRIEFIEENAFSNLKNLQKLDLSGNKLTKFDRNLIGLGNSVEVNIEKNEF